ncbi:MAG: GTP 3',8-cyclase MoaA [Planctomycetota bacterium]|jgi:cyclic pyranopterin phosphate synthase
MRDRYGREITNLRISVTDRCNYRCMYCMPERVRFRPSPENLTYDEILRMVRLAVDLGFTDFRVTGGEPLMRPGILGFLDDLVHLEGVRRVAMTTNGHLLGKHLDDLGRIGVHSINLSMDSLKRDRFIKLARGGNPETVWAAMEACALDERFRLKVNAVILGGKNDDEIEDLAALTTRLPLDVRFIEFMPFGDWDEAETTELVPAEEIQKRIRARFEMEPVARTEYDTGPAEYLKIKGAMGRIGLIRPVSDKFCSDCNRMRLTADGRLKACLLIEQYKDVKGLLRGGASDEDLLDLFGAEIRDKPEKHENARYFSMNETGG